MRQALWGIVMRKCRGVETLQLGSGALFSVDGSEVRISGDESGVEREDYLFELQTSGEWSAATARGPDERS